MPVNQVNKLKQIKKNVNWVPAVDYWFFHSGVPGGISNSDLLSF
jgi:hypothetical protein